jgi:hypothetical protein
MANDPKNTSSTKSVESAENLLADLKKRAEDAHKNNDQFTLNLMSELIKVTSPIVTKAVNRFHREERARINALRRNLREQSPNQRGQSRPNATTNLGG